MSVAKTPTRPKQSTTLHPPKSQRTVQAGKKQLYQSPHNKVDNDMRRQMIAEAAYYIAEHRGFSHGSQENDWILAEQEIDNRFSSMA